MPEPGDAKTFMVIVNGQSFSFTEEELAQADIITRQANTHHIISGRQSVQVITHSVDGKRMHMEVDGDRYDIEIKTSLDQMLDNMGYNNVSTKLIREIRAPMPGLVLDISVQEGDPLKDGQRVVILEAMKMENSIVMHGEGTVKKVHVVKGQPVEKGQVLVELN